MSQKPTTAARAAHQLAPVGPRCPRPRRCRRRRGARTAPARRSAGVEDRAAGHLEDDVDLAADVGLDQAVLHALGRGVDRGVGAELERERALLLASTPSRSRGPAPIGLAELHGERADAARRRRGRPPSRRAATRRARAVQVPRGQALEQQRQRGAVVDAVGDREGQRRRARSRTRRSRRCRSARRRARPCPRARPPPRRRARAAAAGAARYSLRRWWVSAKFIPARETRMRTSPSPGSGVGQLDELEHLGAAELRCWIARMAADPTRAEVRYRLARLMSLTVVGSLAFDAVKTPFGAARAHARRRRHPLRPRRVVLRRGARRRPGRRRLRRGEDWERPAHARDGHRRRRARRRAARRSSGPATTATTSTRARRYATDLNVFEHFEPKLSQASRRTATSCSWPTSSPTSSSTCASSARARGSSRWTR